MLNELCCYKNMNVSQNPDLSKSLTYLVEVETLAQDIITLKETKLELANTLNKLREALRALQGTNDKLSFMQVGALFVENSTEDCKRIVQNEIDKVNEQYDSTCSDLREKILKLRDIEHEPQIIGIGLRPLSYAEAAGITKGFGIK